MTTIGVIGEVSVGKSTLINAILSRYLTSTALKRTTYLPIIFKQANDKDDCDINDYILNKIKWCNEEAHQDSTSNSPLEFKVDFNFTKNTDFKLIDFAGVNDGIESDDKMEKVFFDNFNDLDIIFYVSDCTSSMTLKSEREFFSRLVKHIDNGYGKGKYTQLCVLFNKYDDEDDEIDGIIDSANEYIDDCIDKTINQVEYNHYKISSEKLMIKNIIKYNPKAMKDIPKTSLKRILTEFHGKRKANSILTSNEIKQTDLDEITFTKDESEFEKELKTMSKKKYLEVIIANYINFLCGENDCNSEFTELLKIMQKFSKYNHYDKVIEIYDDNLNDVVERPSISFQDYENLNTYYSLLNKDIDIQQEEYNILFEKITNKLTLDTNQLITVINMIFNKQIDNGLNFTIQDGKTIIELINQLFNNSYPRSIIELLNKHREWIKETHENIGVISSIIDNIMIKYILACEYPSYKLNFDYILSINPELSSTIINYINSLSQDNIKDEIYKFYFVSGSSKPRNDLVALTYQPLVNVYKIKKSKVQYYPTKAILYLNINQYETKK